MVYGLARGVAEEVVEGHYLEAGVGGCEDRVWEVTGAGGVLVGGAVGGSFGKACGLTGGRGACLNLPFDVMLAIGVERWVSRRLPDDDVRLN